MRNQIIALLLAAVLLLAGCRDEQTAGTGQTDGGYNGMSVAVTEIRRTATETVLCVRWENDTQHRVMYGETFSLEVYTDGKWIACERKPDTAFTTIGYMLEPGTVTDKNHTLAWIYGDLPAGDYRFCTGCTVYDSDTGTFCQLYATFSLGAAPSGTEPPPGTPAEGALTEPPALNLDIGGIQQIRPSTYYWQYTQTDGKEGGCKADAYHPLDPNAAIPLIETTNPSACLSFERMPDTITVICWPASAIGNTDAAGEEITISNDSFSLKSSTTGSYIYEIHAAWNKGGTCYGTASYYLRIASYPVMPIPTEWWR